jgi:hypothetical protein
MTTLTEAGVLSEYLISVLLLNESNADGPKRRFVTTPASGAPTGRRQEEAKRRHEKSIAKRSRKGFLCCIMDEGPHRCDRE